MTDLIILATLLSGPKHGYQLKHEAGMILGQQVLHNNLVYPILRRFMNDGWVSRRTVAGERGQTRHRYAITLLGQRELVARLSAFSGADTRSADAFRLRVGLFQLLDSGSRAAILDARQQHLRSRLEKLEAVEANFSLDPYAREVTSQFQRETELELEWIERLRRRDKSSKSRRIAVEQRPERRRAKSRSAKGV